jgi:glycosyltransferase involved in cell wall biosynthesis
MTAGEGLRVGFLGRVPPPLGGAGLELQMERTAAALRELGHEVLQVEAGGAEDSFDVLHAFGTEPAVWQYLRHWTRNIAPLVVTSVVVVSPGREEWALRLSAGMPSVVTGGRMRAEVLRRADAVVAGSEYERRLLERALGVDPAKLRVIGNGADPIEPGEPPDGLPDEPFALMVGAVSARKRHAEVLGAIGDRPPVVIVGPFAGEPTERAEWERTVADAGATWLGPIQDQAVLAAVLARALALVHPSEAEVQSLAVLEALRAGKPVVGSDIPSHRELAEAHSGFVRLVSAPSEVPAALAALAADPPQGAPEVPTWHDVAGELESVYRRVLA